jgi:lysylphosphatidylglycerol synthetase-like protein (DUF2156 family)
VVTVNSPKTRTVVAARHNRRNSQSYWASNQLARADSMVVPHAQRMRLVEQHGDFSLAYATAVQPRLSYFGDAHGYIAFGRRWGYTFVLGDPVTAPDHRANLLEQFLTRYPGSTFCQISQGTAELVQQAGYFVNEMGVDTTLRLPEYDFKGKEKEWLRYAANWTSRRDFVVRELTFDQVGSDQVEGVSEAWRKTRTVKRREVRFLNRPIVLADEPGSRRFYFYDSQQRLLAFVFFDPLYRAGRRIGYVACTKRRHPDAPIYAEQAIMKHAIEVFKQEGYLELRLGLSPLAWIEDQQFCANRLLSRTFRFGFRSKIINKFFYHNQGHAEYKRRFRGEEEKLYFASKALFNSPRLAALIGLMGIA